MFAFFAHCLLTSCLSPFLHKHLGTAGELVLGSVCILWDSFICCLSFGGYHSPQVFNHRSLKQLTIENADVSGAPAILCRLCAPNRPRSHKFILAKRILSGRIRQLGLHLHSYLRLTPFVLQQFLFREEAVLGGKCHAEALQVQSFFSWVSQVVRSGHEWRN